MYDAMVSMIYNMGIDNFRQSNFIQLVKVNKFNEAAEEIKSISKHMFKKYPGLKTRRIREYELFKSGLN
jgi:GH24 family phage-related lysozyme (muramidase)